MDCASKIHYYLFIRINTLLPYRCMRCGGRGTVPPPPPPNGNVIARTKFGFREISGRVWVEFGRDFVAVVGKKEGLSEGGWSSDMGGGKKYMTLLEANKKIVS